MSIWTIKRIALRLYRRKGILFFAFLLLIAVFEGVLRIGEPQGFRIYPQLFIPAGDERRYRMRPGFQYDDTGTTARISTVTIRINGSGFRGPEPVETVLDDRLRIILAGDSLIFGPSLREEQTIAGWLQRLLREKHPDMYPVVYNIGVPGYFLRDTVRTLELECPRIHPKVVFVSYTLSDLHSSECGKNGFLDTMSEKLFANNVSAVGRAVGRYLLVRDTYKSLKERKCEPDRKRMEEKASELLGRLMKLQEATKSRIVFLIFSFPALIKCGTSPDIEVFLSVLAEKYPFPYIEISNLFDIKDFPKYRLHKRDPHPNANCAALIARTIAENPLVKSIVSSSS